MDEVKQKKLYSLKKNLRSVLLSSKLGVAAQKLQGEYKGLMGSFIPYKDFGFKSLEEFMKSIPDVANAKFNMNNVLTYFAVADASTKHIKAMVLKQKSSKRQRLSSSTQRNTTHTPRKIHGYANSYKKNFSPLYKRARQCHSVSDISIKVTHNAPRVIKLRGNMSDPSPVQEKKTVRYANTLEDHDTRRVVVQSKGKNEPTNASQHQKEGNNKGHLLVTMSKESTNTFMNPLMSIENVRKVVTTTKPSIETEVTKPKVVVSDMISTNLKKLLDVNPAGIHATKIAAVYKETFQLVLPETVVSSILNGNFSDILTVNVMTSYSGTKHIILPKNDNEIKTETKSKYLSPTKTKPEKLEVSAHGSLLPGKEYQVTVVNVMECNQVYVQLNSEETDMSKMNQIIHESQKTKAPWGKEQNFQLSSGLVVLTSKGRRAVIQNVYDTECDVLELDFGVISRLQKNSLYPMPAPATKFHEFAICCSMHRPVDTGPVWQPESCAKFKNKFLDEHLTMKVVEISSFQSVETEKLVVKHSVYFYYNGFNINSRLIHEENEYVLSKQISVCDPFHHQPKESARLPDGEYCELFVFNASCTTEVEVCIIGSGYSDGLVDLETEMLEYYTKSNDSFALPQPPPLNCIYAVLSEDACVRGKLISIDGNQGNIYLVDNGELETVDLLDLRPLTEDFCKFPLQVITVSLAGLEHNILASNSEVLQKLNEAVCYKPCIGRIVSHSTTGSKRISNYVELIDTSGEVDVNINQLCASLIMDESYFPSPPETNKTKPVKVVHIENDLIYVQVEGNGLQLLTSLLKKVQGSLQNQRVSPTKFPSDLYPGKMCLVSVAKNLYRARVEQVKDTKVRGISVFLIDIGKTLQVIRGSLMKLECETLLSIPPQAICCQLSPAFGDNGCFGTEGDFLYIGLSEVKDISSQKVLMRVNEISDSEEPHLVSMWIESDNKVRTCIVSDAEINKRTHSETDTQLQSSSMSSHYSSSTSSSSGGDASKDISSLAIPLETSEITKASKCESVDFDDLVQKILEQIQDHNLNDVNDNYLQMHKLANSNMSNFPGTLVPVKVESALSPRYIQLIPLQNIKQRAALETAMTKFYTQTCNGESNPVDIQKGCTYAFQGSNSNAINAWFRVTVQSKINNLFSIYFIDYGHCDVITGTSLFRYLGSHFSDIPPLSMTARLAGIEPIETDWSHIVCDRFKLLVTGCNYYAHVLKRSLDPLLYDRVVFHACLCDTSKDQDVWLEEMLVEDWKCAKYVA
uniref:Uncharacterized protein LOC100183257 n=1 Tax=Phallusia mammillata TaxID=59560 RepID=A0A6F9DIH6_9ASCI|nr:uncharacterized protein LOC100183257 [Phallusia mammillata]